MEKSEDDKQILVVHIFPGSLKPYYLKKLGKTEGTYIRVGATNKKADTALIQQLERERLNISFDAVINYTIKDDMDFEFLEDWYQKKLTNTKLLNLNLKAKESGKEYYTNSALILSGNLENAFVSCARFKGNSTEIFLDRKEFRGNIFSQLENVELFLKNHLMLFGEINGLVRKDTLEIPLLALREAIINAFIHRDYSIMGSNIKIAIFDDHLKITSPGVLPPSISLENILFEERSEIRNPVIARIFKELNLIEQWGTGFTKMRNACLNAGLEKPIVRETANFFQVIFKRPHNQNIKTGGKLAENWRKTGGKPAEYPKETKILLFLEEHSQIKTKDVEELLNVKSSRARFILAQMVKKHFLVKKGKSKNTYYIKF